MRESGEYRDDDVQNRVRSKKKEKLSLVLSVVGEHRKKSVEDFDRKKFGVRDCDGVGLCCFR